MTLLAISPLFSMDGDPREHNFDGPCMKRITKRDGNIYINGKQDVIHRFFNRNDCGTEDLKNVFIKNSLFKQLCVQAYVSKNCDKKQFGILLEKLQSKAIDSMQQMIKLDTQDAFDGLLSCIPRGENYASINGNFVRIMFCRYDSNSEQEEPFDPTDWKFPSIDSPRAKNFKGSELKETGEIEITAQDDYSTNHKNICSKFEKLLKK